ncbi:MAG: DUF1648 domain-containing protein [Chloroflexi bacterium]|uniref:DUF1648 domain-containing protein n=1 Tax=Candidatus Chlorohelix allophototropha TaxID=3003348 RepID=A0A8T7M8S4_9CHLR|nr:DUF1648 domain-containing protein [Chloroflexota bacterium]WJW68467.1 PH domain-containing protein [Chloroflexota bacterium L227-S17]
MKNWKPVSSWGGVIGIILTLLTVGLLGGMLWQTIVATQAPDSAGANFGTFGMGLLCFLLLAVLVGLAFRTFNFYRLRYSLDRNAIVIALGDRRQVIPLANIQHLLPANIVLSEIARQKVTPSQVIPNPEEVESVFASAEPVAEVVAEAKTTPEDEIAEAVVVHVADEKSTEAQTAQKVETPSPRKTPPFTVKGLLLPRLKPRMRLFSYWKGYYVNRGLLEPLGEIQFYSTVTLENTLIIRTASSVYALSPQDPQQFLIEYKLRKNLGATENVKEEIQGGLTLNHPLWHDWLGRSLIAVGVALNLLMFVYLLWRLPNLPDLVRLHFNKLGEVDRISSKGDVMWLPFVGLSAVLLNSIFGAVIHKRERILGLIFFGATLIVQFLLWIALFTVIAERGLGT